MQTIPQEFQAAYREYDREITIQKTRLGCLIGIILVPLFAALDYSLFPLAQAFSFLKLRLICSVLMICLYPVLGTKFGRKYYHFQGVAILFLPSAIIAWMIYATEGMASPYYVGLILVLMVLAVVLDWTFWQSVASVALVWALYLIACFFSSSTASLRIFTNNSFFLVATGITIVTGAKFHSELRLREFISRCELAKSKRELEETNQKLIELDRLKSRFFANISHELRTPLTLLLSPLETLMHRFDRSFDDSARELFATMHANGMRLLKLINDLLDLIRLEAGRMDVKNEPLGVTDFIKGLASAVRQVAEDKRIKLETYVDAQASAILTDRDKLEKIVLNLLFNALKFTPADGRVWVRAEKQNEDFVLSVRDTGMGIAEKSLPFVFDRFWQADSSSKRKFQGVGIGLALVKELVEMLHGKVTVKSQEGKGATFTVRLPYQKAELPAEHEISAPVEDGPVTSEEWLANLYRRAEFFPAVSALQGTVKPMLLTGRRPVVLVADDEPDMRRFLKSELDKDYDLIEAADGAQALEKAGQFLPDIVLLDMMMPEMDGLEVCRKLRERETTVNIPVILLTARADEETKFDALQMGANDFLAKPFSSTELQARIKNLIESHHYQRKLSKQNKALTTAIEQIKETEMQLVQSEKLASLGRLSAGIIHEINNPLNFTMTGLFALRNKGKQLEPKERVEYEEILKDIEEGLKRVRNIVSDLRTFTHPGGGTGEPVEVSEVVNASLRFLAGEWKDVVDIEKNLPPDQIVWANRNKLIHVLVNLVQNSIDSLADKKFDAGGRPTIWIEGRMKGDRGLIMVRDNGMGIDPKAVDKIFDPFFTTKEVGKGMGLGLSICYRIVQGYGGKISVKSEPGRFCEFTLDFPTEDLSEDELETEHGKSLRL